MPPVKVFFERVEPDKLTLEEAIQNLESSANDFEKQRGNIVSATLDPRISSLGNQQRGVVYLTVIYAGLQAKGRESPAYEITPKTLVEANSSSTESYGGMIKRWRKNADLTQLELANRLGVSDSYVGQLECGTRFPSDAMQALLAEFLSPSEEEYGAFKTMVQQGRDTQRQQREELRYEGLKLALGR